MLTADRQRFTERAVRCFLSQTYADAHLLIYDTGERPYYHQLTRSGIGRITVVYNPSARGHKIGALRNEGIDMVKADIIVHWDSDDWSAPERICYQHSTLQGENVAAHGFHNLLFLDTRPYSAEMVGVDRLNRCNGWEYDYRKFAGSLGRSHVVGSSLAYWRSTWAKTPFSETVRYEDPDWCKRVPVYATNGVGLDGVNNPLLIAEVHGGNYSNSYAVFDNHNSSVNPEWRRAVEWDEYCRERLYP